MIADAVKKKTFTSLPVLLAGQCLHSAMTFFTFSSQFSPTVSQCLLLMFATATYELGFKVHCSIQDLRLIGIMKWIVQQYCILYILNSLIL